MTPEERHTKIEAEIEKRNTAIHGLIIVGRTCLDSIQELRGIQDKAIKEARELHKTMREEVRELHKHTDEKLNILIDTVDRIIRSRNDKQ